MDTALWLLLAAYIIMQIINLWLHWRIDKMKKDIARLEQEITARENSILAHTDFTELDEILNLGNIKDAEE